MNPPQRFAIWANTSKPKFWKILPEILRWAERANLEVFLTTRIVHFWKEKDNYEYQVIKSAVDFESMDFILTLGGDGTILGAARALESRNIPILGIHLGDFGFLAKITLQDLYQRLDQVALGDYFIKSTITLAGTVYNNKPPVTYTALNDVVITSLVSHRMVTCSVHANGRPLGHYKADGVIIATPTGSTAYSLAAGGPIVVPDVESIILTPICPHTLTSRPVVLSDQTEISISFPKGTNDVGLSIDGQVHETLTSESQITIKRGEYSIPFIYFQDTDYFTMLRKKMGWGKRGV